MVQHADATRDSSVLQYTQKKSVPLYRYHFTFLFLRFFEFEKYFFFTKKETRDKRLEKKKKPIRL